MSERRNAFARRLSLSACTLSRVADCRLVAQCRLCHLLDDDDDDTRVQLSSVRPKQEIERTRRPYSRRCCYCYPSYFRGRKSAVLARRRFREIEPVRRDSHNFPLRGRLARKKSGAWSNRKIAFNDCRRAKTKTRTSSVVSSRAITRTAKY